MVILEESLMSELAQLVASVSRTFALSISKLPDKLCEAVGLAYLLFRVSDCVEDHPELPAARKAELLELWEQVLTKVKPASVFVSQLASLDGSNPEVNVAQQAERLILTLQTLELELQETIAQRCAKSTLGMARWQHKGPYVETEAELDDYMHQVAGRVGYLMTDIFSWHSTVIKRQREGLLPISRHIGLGLQTVNVIRGLRADYQRGWMFVPGEFLRDAGIDRQQFFLPEFENKSLAVVNRLVQKAEKHLHHGLAYIAAFPPWLHRIRLACIWPLFFAVKTLALSENNPQVIRSEAKISRKEVKEIVQRTTLLGWSDYWLQSYYNKLRQLPFSDPA
jgi:farnesyl-diphosphate farnesyltransferase